MLKETFREYFSFSRKERIAVVMLVLLIGLVFILPDFILNNGNDVNREEFEKISYQLEQLSSESKEAGKINPEHAEGKPLSVKSESAAEPSTGKVNMFYFEPNTLSAEGWKKLGLRDKTIATIQKYLAKGGRFRHADDLKKIYGLRKDEAERLLPFVKVEEQSHGNTNEKVKTTYPASRFAFTSPRPAINKTSVDINLADTTALISLPGIGPKLASRIILFRNKLGGFYSVDQLAEVYGLPDSTFRLISTRLISSTVRLATININQADINQLRQHPYLRWNVANALVEYRRQHGEFKSIDDLKNVDAITPELLKKITPYLSVR